MTQTLPVLLMTRPEAQSVAFAGALGRAEEDFRLVVSPLIGVEVTGPLPEQDGLRGLVFTSANGVRAWCQLGGRRDLPAFTVGAATAEAAAAEGIAATSADGDAEALIAMLMERRPDAPLMHARGRHSRGDVAGRLSAAGIETRAAVIYDQPVRPLSHAALSALAGNVPVVAPLFSPRTAALLSEVTPVAPLCVAAMSEAVAKALLPLHKRYLRIASRPESAAMRDLVADLLQQVRAGEI